MVKKGETKMDIRSDAGVPQAALDHAVPVWADASSAGKTPVCAAAFPEEGDDHGGQGDEFFQRPQVVCSPNNGEGWAFLRHEFTFPDVPVRSATLHASASSTKPARQFVYRMWMNGRFVGLGPVFPIGGESRVNAFDVTALLKPGANAVGVVAWTMQDRRFWAYLDVELVDGRHIGYGTGPQWKGIVGNRAYPNAASVGTQYFEAPAEDVQTQYYPFGFSQPGFDDDAWPAVVTREPLHDLQPTPTANVDVRHHAPQSAAIDDKGTLVVDFGRAWVGGVRLDLRSLDVREDVDIRIRYGEVLDDNGNVQYRLSAFNTYQDTWHIVPGAPSLETWGIRVFRYVQLVPADTPASRAAVRRAANAISAAAIEYPLDGTSADFRSSDTSLNMVWRFCRNSIEALNGPIYVDSWTRERAPYEADAWLQQRAHLALDCGSDAVRLGRYSIDWLIANRTWPTEWPMYLILAVHDSWMACGDLTQAREQYDALRSLLPNRYLDEASGLIVKEPGEASVMDGDLIDWPPAERDGFVFSSANTVINALAHAAYRAVSELAGALGDTAAAARYAAVASRIQTAINTRLWDEEQGAYVDGLEAEGQPLRHASLHANAFVLAFVDVHGPRRARIAEFVRRKGMCCGPYVAAVLLEGLYRNGFGALANQMIGDDDPSNLHSWRHMIATGGGATMEGWDVSIKGNTTYSHPWSASPAYLLVRGMLGIRPLEPGYRRFEVRPQLGDVREVSATVPTPLGTIRVHCVNDGTAVSVDLDVPEGAVAEIGEECDISIESSDT